MAKNNDILNELIGSSYSEISLSENSRVINVPLDELYNREDNREIDFEEVKKIAASIATDGLGQPILVRKVDPKEGYEVIAGQHRLEAYKMLAEHDVSGKWNKIPSFVKNIDNDSAKRLMLATNIVNNEIAKDERQKYLVDLVEEIKKERKLNPNKYNGKTSAIVADFVSSSTGEDVSQASIERTLKAKKDEKEVDGDITSYIQKSSDLTCNWKAYCSEKPDLTIVKSISDIDNKKQDAFYANLKSVYGNFNNFQVKQGLTCLNNKKQNTVDKYMKTIESFFDYLELSKRLGNDVLEDLIAVQNLLTLKSSEMNEEL